MANTTTTPPPFDPPDEPAVWNSLNSSARAALVAFRLTNTPPGTTTAGALAAAGCIAAVGSVWGLTDKGFEVVAYARAKGLA